VQTHFVKIRECWSTFCAHLAIPHDSNKSVTRKTDQPFLLNMLQQSTPQIRTTSTTAIRAKIIPGQCNLQAQQRGQSQRRQLDAKLIKRTDTARGRKTDQTDRHRTRQ
jgi:hypothetical protein